jgi:hypothetical protein
LSAADAAAFDALLASVSAAQGATALTATNCAVGSMRRLASAILARPDVAAALERLDLSSDSGLKLHAEGGVVLARCLDACSALVELNLTGCDSTCAPADGSFRQRDRR